MVFLNIRRPAAYNGAAGLAIRRWRHHGVTSIKAPPPHCRVWIHRLPTGICQCPPQPNPPRRLHPQRTRLLGHSDALRAGRAEWTDAFWLQLAATSVALCAAGCFVAFRKGGLRLEAVPLRRFALVFLRHLALTYLASGVAVTALAGLWLAPGIASFTTWRTLRGGRPQAPRLLLTRPFDSLTIVRAERAVGIHG